MPADSEFRYSRLFENEIRKSKQAVFTDEAMKVAVPNGLLCGAMAFSLTYVYSHSSAKATFVSTFVGFSTFIGTLTYHTYRNIRK
ncbi:hypothetical protein ACF0H5_003733 [Mactra antiquata]